MLGTFPKAFFEAATSQGYYPKWKLHNCAISQVVTSQACPSRSARPHCSLRRPRRPNLTFGKLSLRKLHIWEVFTWENGFGKVSDTGKIDAKTLYHLLMNVLLTKCYQLITNILNQDLAYFLSSCF